MKDLDQVYADIEATSDEDSLAGLAKAKAEKANVSTSIPIPKVTQPKKKLDTDKPTD